MWGKFLGMRGGGAWVLLWGGTNVGHGWCRVWIWWEGWHGDWAGCSGGKVRGRVCLG